MGCFRCFSISSIPNRDLAGDAIGFVEVDHVQINLPLEVALPRRPNSAASRFVHLVQLTALQYFSTRTTRNDEVRFYVLSSAGFRKETIMIDP